MKKLIVALFVVMALVACSQNSKKAESAPAAANAEVTNLAAVQPDVLLPEVAEKYSGIVIELVGIQDNSSKKTDVPFGKETTIEGSPYTITVFSYFPNFTMVEGGVANRSMDEENPASKVEIKQGKEVVFSGWLFAKFPDMHGFTTPQHQVKMLAPKAK